MTAKTHVVWIERDPYLIEGLTQNQGLDFVTFNRTGNSGTLNNTNQHTIETFSFYIAESALEQCFRNVLYCDIKETVFMKTFEVCCDESIL